MPVTYVRNAETGEFEKVGPGGATTDTTLSMAGKPADAAAVGAALSYKVDREYVDSSISYLSNPNLLINSDFRNPINQRGSQSYESKTSGKDTYSIDRWHASYGTIVTVNSGNITIAGNTSSNRYFYQTFERQISGTFTLSFDIANRQGNVSLFYDTNGTAKTVGIPEGANQMTFTATNVKSVGFLLPKTNGTSITINWAKLEVGSVATQFTPRLYPEELAMCRRYYQNIDLHCSTGLSSDDGTEVTFATNVYLRDVPSITIKVQPKLLRRDSTNDITTTLTFSSVYCKENVCSATFKSSASLGSRTVVWPIYEFAITADAEIY